MIVVIGTNHPAAAKLLDWVWYDPPDERKPRRNYHLTVAALDQFLDLSAVIIPSKPDGRDYSARVLIEHIRLSAAMHVSRVPIYIAMSERQFEVAAEKDLDDIGSEGIDWVADDAETLSPMEPLTTDDHKRVVPLLGASPQYTGTRHHLANQWGSYRLLHQLDNIGYKQDSTKQLREDLRKDAYFKRLLLIEDDSTKASESLLSEFASYFEIVTKKKLKVAVIEDKYHRGWDVAYQALFPNSELIGFNFQGGKLFNPGDSNQFDLVLLDLRLEEDSHHDESDILGVDKMSGMQVLKAIRSTNKLVPIIMCTASNKSWSYQAAIDNGANGYWEKESPDWGTGSEYNQKNTLNLILTIKNALNWSWIVKPIIEDLWEIASKFTDSNTRQRILRKTEAIIDQLHKPQNMYGDTSEQSAPVLFNNEVVAFLIAWSIGNEITEYYRLVNGSITFTNIGVHTREFCEDIGNYGYQLAPDAIGVFHRAQDRTFHAKDFDRLFTQFLFCLKGMTAQHNRYQFLRKVRNKNDYIHGKPGRSPGEFAYKRGYLKELTTIWIDFLHSDVVDSED
jgi:CheY-like chemotaxis protein